MKNLLSVKALSFLLTLTLLISCQKEFKPGNEPKDLSKNPNEDNPSGHLKQTKTFSSDVVISWINLQLQMNKLPLPAGTAGAANDRCQVYCGLALYESVVEGMPSYQTLHGQLTDYPAMPSTEPGKAYHWGACANAALAEMNRRLFPLTADANKTAITNLENSWNAIYAAETPDATLQRSIAYGKEVATRIYNWAATDGSANVNPPYTIQTGPGKWEPTAPPPAVPVGPYSYQRRKIVPGVADGTALVPPPAFSTTVGSPFWNMVNEIYTNYPLTADKKALADYYKDVPGYGPGGTYVAIMVQALDLTKPSLDKAALTYAKVGLATFDATTVLFTNKYEFLLIRPVTYIRSHIDGTFTTYVPTPNHPEFPSGHSTTGGAAIGMMTDMFGENFNITLHTYDYLNYPTRSYTNFTDLLHDISLSRLYGGLHYRETLVKSEAQGRKVAENILQKVKFKK